jgi:hypothetical protein
MWRLVREPGGAASFHYDNDAEQPSNDELPVDERAEDARLLPLCA